MPGPWMRPDRDAALPHTATGEELRRAASDPIAACYREHGSLLHPNPTAQLFRRPWDGSGGLSDVLAATQELFRSTWPDAKFDLSTDHAMLAGVRAAHYVVRMTQEVRVEDLVLRYRTLLTGYTMTVPGYVLTFTVARSTNKRYRADEDVAAMIASTRFERGAA